MRMSHLILILSTSLIITSALLITFYISTDPYRGYDFDRMETEPIIIEETYSSPQDLVQHPITGKWITQEQAEREQKVLEAILCNGGYSEYC